MPLSEGLNDAKAKYSLSMMTSPTASSLVQNVKVNIDLRSGTNPPSAQISSK